jgi:hypothetical protein
LSGCRNSLKLQYVVLTTILKHNILGVKKNVAFVPSGPDKDSRGGKYYTYK